MWNRGKELQQEYLTKPSTDPPLEGEGAESVFFFLTDYVDDFILVRVEQEPSDQTGLIVSASLASDHVSKKKKSHSLLQKQHELGYDRTCARAHTINTHTMRSSITPEKVATLKRFAGDGMAERTGRSQRLGGTEHCRKTIEYLVRCESGAVLCMAAATPYQLAFEPRQNQ